MDESWIQTGEEMNIKKKLKRRTTVKRGSFFGKYFMYLYK